MERKEINTGIFRLSERMEAISEELMENGGEITPEMEGALIEVNENQIALIDGIFGLQKKSESDISAIDAEIKRLQGLKKARKTAVESLKAYLLKYMQENGIEKIEGSLTSAKIRAGVEKVEVMEDKEIEPYLGIIEEARRRLPDFIKIDVKVGKTELKEWIKGGNPVRSAIIVKNNTLKLG